MKRRLINLNDPQLASSDLVVQFRGRPVRLSLERVAELLEIEELWVTSQIGGSPLPAVPSPEPEAATRAPSPPPEPSFSDIESETVSHASLSYRIKRVFTFSQTTRSLRDAHRRLLLELIDRFDWEIPEHPNTQLERHLREIIEWISATDARTAGKLDAFLKRYVQRRYTSKASA